MVNRIARWLGMFFGILGVILCAAGFAGVYIYYPIATQKTEEIYTSVDDTLAEIETRFELTGDWVAVVSKMTADLRTNLRQRLRAEIKDQKQVGQRAELIAERLHQARDALDAGCSFLTKVRGVQRLAHPMKKEVNTELFDTLIEEAIAIRNSVGELSDSFDRVRQMADESGDTELLEKRIEQALKDVVRLMGIVDTVEGRLNKLSGQVSEIRLSVTEFESQIQRDLWWGHLAAYCFLLWMAIGQFALFRMCLK